MRKAVDTGTGQVEAMLRGDVSILARTLLFRACDLHRLVIARLGPAAVEEFLRDCEMLCVQVEQTLRDVQASRSRLRFVLLWLEQMAGIVANDDGGDVGGGEGEPPHPPCLTLANSILTILREPLPTDERSSSSPGAAAAAAGVSSARSRVESVIGTSVPGLAADGHSAGPVAAGGAPSSGTGRKDRFIVLDEDPVLASRTIQEQVVACREDVRVASAPLLLVRRRVCLRRARLLASPPLPQWERFFFVPWTALLSIFRSPRMLEHARPLSRSRDNADCSHLSDHDRQHPISSAQPSFLASRSRGGKGLDVVWVTVVPMGAIPVYEEGEAASPPRVSR
ncbi:unnamed protein product [Scytosiphon promiscuus]